MKKQRKPRSTLHQLVTASRIRNRLLAGKALHVELRAAAKRVMRLSNPGTPQRFFTVIDVSDATGFSGPDIVDEIVRLQDEAAPTAPHQEK
jgi:hypothetical protein